MEFVSMQMGPSVGQVLSLTSDLTVAHGGSEVELACMSEHA
jgi:hypothetical protein